MQEQRIISAVAAQIEGILAYEDDPQATIARSNADGWTVEIDGDAPGEIVRVSDLVLSTNGLERAVAEAEQALA